VRAVIAKSIERIHMANLVNFGILPLTFNDQQDYEKIQVGDELFIADIERALNQSAIIVKNITRGGEFGVSFRLTPRQIAIIRIGGLLNYVGK
jgi:aconitate hydratase